MKKVTIYLDHEHDRIVGKAAKERCVSRSEVIRQAIADYIGPARKTTQPTAGERTS